MNDIKNGDVIFFGHGDSIMTIEHLAEVEEYDEVNNVVTTTKSVTLMKQPTPTGLSVSEIPSMLIASTLNRLENKRTGKMYINLNNFDIYGKCIDDELVNRFKMVSSGIMTDKVTDEELEAVADNAPKLRLI